jgi:uncharacterized protein (TIGR03435 family)
MRITIVLIAGLVPPAILAQSTTVPRPKFAVVSVKPCRDEGSAPDRKRGRGGGDFSPGTLRLDCRPVMNLIESAYILFANGHVNPHSHVLVEGGPAWIRSLLYQIDAKTDGARSQGMMHGPMLQTLLEDRFKLKLHRETREVPAYALTVAKGGPKLQPFQEGTCTPLDFKIFEQFPPPPSLPELPQGQKYCGGIDPTDGTRWIGALATKKGTNVTLEARAMTIDDFIHQSLGSNLDRPVVNKTGITGLFDFHLEFAADENTPGVELSGPSIFSALQRQLGLKLEPAKGLGDFLVIDQVQKPSAN